MTAKVLVADDEEASRKGLAGLLSAWGYSPEEAGDGEEALEKARAVLPSVVITDLVMPKQDGLALLRALREELPFATVILLSGQGSVDAAVAAMKEGAYDFLTKPVDVGRLKILVPKAVERAEAVREVALLRRRVKQVWGVGNLVGTSPAMQGVYRLIELAAPTPAAVLITGESGTGKELVARTLHELSGRRGGPFVAVNCAAIPETLLESEIFGHEKGAFTGALERRPGCFELAHEGTIFLDEIAEMAPGTQAKFLRILEDGAVRRLGAKTEIKVDARLIAATNQDPVEAMRAERFREDLYYRLNVVRIELPPLRDRREDIPLLLQAFIEEFGAKYGKQIVSVDEAARQDLMTQTWPGNIRELRNTLERAVIVCDGELIRLEHLPAPAGALVRASSRNGEHPNSVVFNVGTSLDDVEKEMILRTLAANGNNKTSTAHILGISLKTLHNKLRRYGS
ncbi:MAG TPA: sigma-54 dependent transcriptional regulator [Candidatus Methylomirabilis sp.]|nr:sigma-54 dependent transcriptional regulator [Candidatus Methylomirabilis sp.]